MDKYLENLKKYANENHIPIISDSGCDFLLDFLGKIKPNNILEIGTAVGYSGSLILKTLPSASLVTVEKNENFVHFAKQTFEKVNVYDRVTQIHDDAYNFIKNTEDKYDFVFLDGPKGQYLKYYPYIKKLLKTGGYIFVDNIYFHNLVLGPEFVKHKLRTIVVNLRKFIDFIQHDSEVKVTFYEIGDGIAIINKL